MAVCWAEAVAGAEGICNRAGDAPKSLNYTRDESPKVSFARNLGKSCHAIEALRKVLCPTQLEHRPLQCCAA